MIGFVQTPGAGGDVMRSRPPGSPRRWPRCSLVLAAAPWCARNAAGDDFDTAPHLPAELREDRAIAANCAISTSSTIRCRARTRRHAHRVCRRFATASRRSRSISGATCSSIRCCRPMAALLRELSSPGARPVRRPSRARSGSAGGCGARGALAVERRVPAALFLGFARRLARAAGGRVRCSRRTRWATTGEAAADPERQRDVSATVRRGLPDGARRDHAPQVYTAIAAFQSTLVSFNSRYDRYAHGYAAALNEREIAGPQRVPLVCRALLGMSHAAAVHERAGRGDRRAGAGGPCVRRRRRKDLRRTQAARRLPVPTLRNIARTAPYMHSGTFATLRETVKFYNGGRGHAVPKDQALYLHWHISRRT